MGELRLRRLRRAVRGKLRAGVRSLHGARYGAMGVEPMGSIQEPLPSLADAPSTCWRRQKSPADSLEGLAASLSRPLACWPYLAYLANVAFSPLVYQAVRGNSEALHRVIQGVLGVFATIRQFRHFLPETPCPPVSGFSGVRCHLWGVFFGKGGVMIDSV